MNFSYQWLQAHFPEKLPEPNELGEVVGLHSFELEGIEESGKDVLIDWDVLPNRSSDCLSYQGLAHEITAVLDTTHNKWIDEVNKLETSLDIKTSEHVTLDVQDNDLVKRATKRLATGVQVGESPSWLKERLESIGQKSINNVVDITNYVMWETGQPVHAFDYDRLAGEGAKQVSIRAATEGEALVDLTGAEHTLDSSVLVIADSEKALDIAGVKGGMDSGVSESTTRVLLSACNFDFQTIRNTSRKLRLQTDASKRFENEVPLGKIDDAMQLFSYLLQEYAGATIAEDILDTNPDVPTRAPLLLSVATTNSILGLNLDKEEIVSLLGRVGCEVIDRDEDFEVIVPTERLDISFAGDLIEEIGRLYGYENFEPIMPEEGFPLPEVNHMTELARHISEVLVGHGFYEVKSRTIISSGTVELANPLTKKAGFLRNNLGEALVTKAEKNLAYTDEPKLFEIGKIFSGADKDGVTEAWHWAGVIGKRKIKEKQKQEVFLQTKGYVDAVADAVGVSLTWEEHIDEAIGAVAAVSANGEYVGLVGVNWWEINMELLRKHVDTSVNYIKPSKYPLIDRDVAVFVSAKTPVADVQNLIKKELPQETVSFELFDVFEKEDKKSLAFRMVFQSQTETLSDEWANGVMDKVYKTLEKEGFEIR